MWNVPNTLTIARLVLAICCFVALGVDAYGTALVLLALVLSMNVVATVIRSYFRRRRQW